jgi:alanine dehydrogenase
VAITPAGVHELVQHGHTVTVEAGAGLGSSIADEEYAAAGASLEADADTVWGEAEMVLKVKEPIAPEYHRMREGLVLFTYLHLAADKPLTEELLAPMSEVAGRLAPQVGAATLQKANGGRGVLLGGVPGVAPAKVAVIGAGVSGLNAAKIAAGMGAQVRILDLNVGALRRADQIFGGAVETLASNKLSVEQVCIESDLVIGAVLVPGAKAPTLVSNELVSRMKPGSVLVDISIDQGGCFEDSRPTTHADPTFPVHDAVFYCVANMPGAVAHTSTYALTNVTMPYAVALANKGWQQALRDDPALALGLNTHAGELTNAPVGEAVGISSTPLERVLD